MASLKAALAVVGAIASSILVACSNPQGANDAVPSDASGARVVVAGRVVPASSLSFLTRELGSSDRGLRIRRDVAKGTVLYASLFEGAVFHEYVLPKRKPLCQSQPYDPAIVNAIGTDKDGTLWVPAWAYQSWIYSYDRNCGGPVTTLSTLPLSEASGIAFGPDGTKFGLMTYLNPSNTVSFVSVYPTGATSPMAELNDPRLTQAEPAGGVGVDSAGHVYVTCCGILSGPPIHFAIKFTGKGSQNSGKQIVLKQTTTPGGSVTFDRANNMIVPDNGGASLNVYAPPYTGKPTVHSLKGTPFQCALSPKQSTIACTNLTDNTVDLYTYPSMSYQYSLKATDYPSVQVAGVAFGPKQ